MSLRNERLVLEDTHVHTRPVSSLPALLMRLTHFLKAQQSNLRHSISAPDCVHSYRLLHAWPFTTSPYSRILSGYRVTFACHSPFASSGCDSLSNLSCFSQPWQFGGMSLSLSMISSWRRLLSAHLHCPHPGPGCSFAACSLDNRQCGI